MSKKCWDKSEPFFKTSITLFLTLLVVISLSGCGEKKTTSEKEVKETKVNDVQDSLEDQYRAAGFQVEGATHINDVHRLVYYGNAMVDFTAEDAFVVAVIDTHPEDASAFRLYTPGKHKDGGILWRDMPVEEVEKSCVKRGRIKCLR
ncbi:MAG: hypothetical protein MPJ24_11800 [Pirellulaceae bacterium]|nr:hypothetical protein [Pirellulaceae bacterium]